MSDKELKQNLLRFIMHTFTENCNEGIHSMIDDTVNEGKGSVSGYCRVRKKMSTQEFQMYKLTLTLEEVDDQ